MGSAIVYVQVSAATWWISCDTSPQGFPQSPADTHGFVSLLNGLFLLFHKICHFVCLIFQSCITSSGVCSLSYFNAADYSLFIVPLVILYKVHTL